MSGLHPVFAICGLPGAGKTGLCAALALALGWPVIAYDDHEQMTERAPEAVTDWMARGAPVAEVPVPGLRAALLAAAARGPVLFDTPMGRLHPETADLIGHAVWLDCPADVALSRKLLQMLRESSDRGGLEGWLEGYLANYLEFVRPLLVQQVTHVRPLCDLRLDAKQDPKVLTARLVTVLGRRVQGQAGA
jgi:uridine kinase